MNRVFTHRADRVAKAVERRGIRATYKLHDHVLSNRKSRARYEDDRPELDDLQRRILADVEENGFATASFGELFPNESHWRDLEAMRDHFVAETEADLAKGGMTMVGDMFNHGLLANDCVLCAELSNLLGSRQVFVRKCILGAKQ